MIKQYPVQKKKKKRVIRRRKWYSLKKINNYTWSEATEENILSDSFVSSVNKIDEEKTESESESLSSLSYTMT